MKRHSLSYPISHLPTPEDDSSSCAESTAETPKVRRTEAERIQIFMGDPKCGGVEPYRVYCTPCNKWLSLGRNPYGVSHWYRHCERCHQQAPKSEKCVPVCRILQPSHMPIAT